MSPLRALALAALAVALLAGAARLAPPAYAPSSAASPRLPPGPLRDHQRPFWEFL